MYCEVFLDLKLIVFGVVWKVNYFIGTRSSMHITFKVNFSWTSNVTYKYPF